MNLANAKYDELIMSYLDGQCTEKEAMTLLSWIAESESNRDYFDSFKDVWSLTAFNIPGIVDVESALESVNAKIEAAEEKATNIVEMPWLRRNYKLVSGIAATVVVALFLGFLITKPFDSTVTLAYNGEQEMSEYTLPDGSIVSFDGESQVNHPKQFADETRSINFDGKAYFDIVADAQRPFVIHCNDMDVEVLGTSFLLEAGKEFDIYRLDLFSGKVKMTANGNEAIIEPGERGLFNPADKSLKVMSFAEVKEHELKTDHVLDFNDVPLPVIVETIEHIFNVKIGLDETLESENFTVRFTDEDPVEEMLETIATAFDRDVVKDAEGHYSLR